MMWKKARYSTIASVLAFVSLDLRSDAFVQNHGLFFYTAKRKSSEACEAIAFQKVAHLFTLNSSLLKSSVEQTDNNIDGSSSAATRLIHELQDLCQTGKLQDAIALLEQTEHVVDDDYDEEVDWSDESCYSTIFKELARTENSQAPELADALLKRMIVDGDHNVACIPTSVTYNSVMTIWGGSKRKEAGKKCCHYLETLWSLYAETNDPRYVPSRSSYISTITALSRSRQGREGATRAEQLLEEMEERRQKYPHLAPTTIAVNGVLNAWSKSGVWRGAATRCEEILERMISMHERGCSELQPDTTSFNTAMDTLAKSREEDSERRAEALLEKMDSLSSRNDSLSKSCRPDQMSFNIVLNCWALSRERGAARRATSILQHMETRYATNNTEVRPDTASYTTVINAWARSREKDAVRRAEEVLGWCEEANKRGNPDVNPNALTYNSMINCYSKSNLADASDRAVELLDSMKAKSLEQGCQDCHPDVITYTSVIDTLAKKASMEASQKAESLLHELEASFSQTCDKRMKPNIRTYTSAINAIARSRSHPERAEVILNRIESSFAAGDREVKPDVVSYNALINAYGWSNQDGKSTSCFKILNRMIEFHDSRRNLDAKPDIITCNSVLNACAFEKARSESERATIMDVVAKTLDIFQASAPKYGFPDHSTYAQVLLAISKHMPMNDRRLDMAETTFWQCCKGGHVSAMVIANLRLALSWPRFAALLGSALRSKEGESLKYNMQQLPEEWRKYAPLPSRNKPGSRPSRKRDRGFQITKSTLSKGKKASM